MQKKVNAQPCCTGTSKRSVMTHWGETQSVGFSDKNISTHVFSIDTSEDGVRQQRGISMLTYKRPKDLSVLITKSPPCRIFKQPHARLATKLANRGHNVSHHWPQWLRSFQWQCTIENYLNPTSYSTITALILSLIFSHDYHHVNKDQINTHFIIKLQTMISTKALL